MLYIHLVKMELLNCKILRKGGSRDVEKRNYSVLNKPPEQGAVSYGSPSQASAEGALAHWRDLNFLPLEQVRSHSDHSPHSAQVLAAPAEKREKKEIDNFLLDELLLSMSNLTSIELSQLGRHRR